MKTIMTGERRRRSRWALFVATLVGVTVVGAGRARAEMEPPTGAAPATEAIDSGKWRIELTVGYGHTMYFAAHPSDDLDRQFVVTSARLGLFASSLDFEPPLKGTFEILAAVDVVSQFSPWGGYAFGLGPLFRYDFWTGTPVVPFAEFGFGLAPNDFGHPEQGGHFAFELQGGIGAQWFVAEGVALVFEYRFHHVSSAFLYAPNYGVNTSVFSFGTAIFF